MKNLLIALLLLPATVFGQSKSIESFINQYEDNDDVSVVSIEGSLFSLIASMADFEDDDSENDEEMEAVKRVFGNIESMKIVSVPYKVAKFDNTKIKEFRSDLKKDNYTELMSLRDDGKNMTFMAQGEESELSNMVVLIDEEDKLTVLSVIGSLDMKDLALLARNHDDFH